jgi:lysophospholipase L1-like esterase
MFDTTTPYSLISRLAMDMPIGSKRSITQQAASAIISNPFTGLLHGLASVFNRSDSVFATSSALVNDPFGVTQYGYPDAAASIPSDPETYWDQNCTNGTALQQYNNQAASQTDDNGLPLNTSPDPCLLIQATVGSVGGYYDSSLLSSDDLADSNSNGSTTTTTTPTASNSNYYQIGDSLSVGMAASGLASDLAKGNWDISKIEANTGYTIEASEPLLQTDQSDISNAGIIVVELGTNDIYETQAQIVSDIQNMVSAIKTVNSTAQIDWVNTYSTLLPGYKTVNAAISQEATSLGYTVLDWASEAINNPSLYDFNSSDGLGVHQATGAGYQAMSNWLAGQIGEAPSSQSSDIVRNLLNSPSSPSLTSKFANVLKGFDNLFTPPVKLKGLAESK